LKYLCVITCLFCLFILHLFSYCSVYFNIYWVYFNAFIYCLCFVHLLFNLFVIYLHYLFIYLSIICFILYLLNKFLLFYLVWLIRYRDSLWAGRFGNRIPVGWDLLHLFRLALWSIQPPVQRQLISFPR
jgi:hypothetical protein